MNRSADNAATVGQWVTALIVSIAPFMEVLDTSIANVSLPHIAGNLSATLDETTWVLTSYLVANAIVLPLAGWMSRVVGRKRWFLFCLALFTGSSALCGLSTSLTWLILARILQGVGGGGLVPVSQAILLDTFPKSRQSAAMALFGVAIMFAPIFGPTVGGWVTDNLNWRWVFYINVPIGAFALAVNSFLLHESPEEKAQRAARKGGLQIDYVGLALLALGLGCLEVMLDRGERSDWFASRYIQTLAGLALFGIVGTVVWELRHPHPIVNLRLFADRNFGLSCLAVYLVFATLFGAIVLMPEMVQTLMGYSATLAGLVLSPGGVVTMMLMPVAAWLTGRIDARWVLAASLLGIALSLWLMAHISLQVSFWQLVELRLVQSAAMGLFWVPINAIAFAFIARRNSTEATGLFNLVRNEGSSLGISLSATLLARRGQFHQFRLIEHVTPLNPVAGEAIQQASQAAQHAGADPVTASDQGLLLVYRLVAQQAQTLAYLDAFWVFMWTALALAPLVFLLRRPPRDAETTID